MHSVINAKPIDAFHRTSEEGLGSLRKSLVAAQEDTLKRCNQNKNMKTYHPGENVFLRRNKRLGNKLDKVFYRKLSRKILVQQF